MNEAETFEAFKHKVVKAIEAKLGDQPWFAGTAILGLKDFWIDGDLEGAIEFSLAKTIDWDCPGE